MEPAAQIIEKLGGVNAVAKVTGVHRTRVSNWKRPRESGGTGGTIPLKHFHNLMAEARRLGVDLSAADFVGTTDRQAAE